MPSSAEHERESEEERNTALASESKWIQCWLSKEHNKRCNGRRVVKSSGAPVPTIVSTHTRLLAG